MEPGQDAPGEGAVGRILVVCTGNICRSPYIARMLQPHLDRRWGPGRIVVDSAGTPGLDGEPMDERAGALLRRIGGDPQGHVASRLTEQRLRGTDLVLTAERDHRARVALTHPPSLRRSFTFVDFADLAEQVGDDELPQTADPVAWLREVTATVAGKRGVVLPLEAADADIVDPYLQPDAVYGQMVAQVSAATPQVLRMLTGPTSAR